MENNKMLKMKKILSISLAFLFLVSLTASAVSADTYDGTKDLEHHAGGDGHGGGDVHLDRVHEDNGNGNDGLNNGQGNYGTAGYDNQQDGTQSGEHMGSEYAYM
jgi:hypothetical protein